MQRKQALKYHGFLHKDTCFLYIAIMATMAAMEAMAAMINLRIFGMKKINETNDNELFKGWIKSFSS